MNEGDRLYEVQVKITLDLEVRAVSALNPREAAHRAVQQALNDLEYHGNIIKGHEIVSTRAKQL